MPQARKPALRAVKTPAPIYQLHIELLGHKPAIWRRVVVPGSIKLSRLHVVILTAMGWMGGHLHDFDIGGINYGTVEDDQFGGPPVEDERRYTLAKAVGPLKSFTYVYDFGDYWRHRVKVEKILPAAPPLEWPMCLTGRNACPPEDVGGTPGCREFLEAIGDPAHPEHESMLEWVGGHFDPTEFDPMEVNSILINMKP